MQSTKYRFFILQTNEKILGVPEKIIIWGDDEEDARRESPTSLPQIILPESNLKISELKTPYFDPSESTCEELMPDKDYTIIESDQEAVKIKLNSNGEEYTFIKGPKKWHSL